MSELFVSYASVDRPRTMQIVDAVRGHGLEVWIDQAGIAGGTSYGTEIANALRDAQAVLLVASDASLASKNVRQEIMLAWRYDKPIIPLILHPLVFPDDVAYWLEGSQWIEVLDREPDAWMPKLRQALARHGFDSAPAPDVAPPTSEPLLELAGNLPTSPSPILGRSREIEEIQNLLAHSRALTLTGPGGTGKTRLAMEIGRRAGPSFSGGAWFLDLSAVRDADLVLPSVAETLEIELLPDRSALEALGDALTGQPTLIILDNLEQIDGVGTELSTLLDAIPTVTLLMTSRSATRVVGEWVYPVPQLALPDLGALPPPAVLIDNPAVRLFVTRAQRARDDFQLIDGNARVIAEICHRLDGLPLAIEIAAARTRMLPPAVILTRLGSSLRLLTRGDAASARQQTLRDTIGWSYHLLGPAHQHVFRSFAVFSGGASIDAAEAVLRTAEPDEEIVDVLEELVEQSLLIVESPHDGANRVRMLETIRAYAIEQFELDAEAEAVRRAHGDFFVTLLEGSSPSLVSAASGGGSREVRTELANVRSALAWSKTLPDTSRWARMVHLLVPFWQISGPYAEAVDELAALAESTEDPLARAQAHAGLGWFAGARGDFREARQLFADALADFALADRADQVAEMQLQLAMTAEFTGDYEAARAYHLARRAHHERAGAPDQLAVVDHDLGRILSLQGDYDGATTLLNASLAHYRGQEDAQILGIALIDLATVEMFQGAAPESLKHIAEAIALLGLLQDDYALAVATATQARAQQLAGDFVTAARTIDEAQERAEALGDANLQSLVLYTRGTNALGTGALADAERIFLDDLDLARAHGDRWRIAEIYDRLATIAVATGRAEDAARYLGRAAREREETGGHIPPVNLAEYEGTEDAAREMLGEEGFGALWEEGRGMDEVGEREP